MHILKIIFDICLLRGRAQDLPASMNLATALRPLSFGLVIVLFLMFEPHGIYGQWLKIRQFFSEYPLYRKATHKRQKTYLRTERVR